MAEVHRWYQGYRYNKKPKELIEKISIIVQDQEISSLVPLLRIEKGARGGKLYYFFLAIESEKIGNIPLRVRDSNLLKCHFFQIPAVSSSTTFKYEEIKSMVGVAHDVTDYTNPIPYQEAIKQVKADDPFDIFSFTDCPNYELEATKKLEIDNPFNTSSFINESTFDLELSSKRCQQLLYWLSAVGNGTWELFKKACQTLELDKPQHILRKLTLLGHIESSSDGKHWSIAPTALVQIESQSENQEFILCGQQNEDLLRELKQYATIKLIDRPQDDAPTCVLVQLTNSKEVEQVIQSVRNRLGLTINQVGNVANQLTDVLPNLERWESRLQNIKGIKRSLYDWKFFDGKNFVDNSLFQQTGMYQRWDREEGSRLRMTLFYNSETDIWRQGDWYGLRFLAMHYNNQTCIARYDSATARLAIPFSQRWPQLYERALVLTSGKLPSYNRTEQNSWLIYENMSIDIVQKLTNKLHVTCNP